MVQLEEGWKYGSWPSKLQGLQKGNVAFFFFFFSNPFGIQRSYTLAVASDVQIAEEKSTTIFDQISNLSSSHTDQAHPCPRPCEPNRKPTQQDQGWEISQPTPRAWRPTQGITQPWSCGTTGSAEGRVAACEGEEGEGMAERSCLWWFVYGWGDGGK